MSISINTDINTSSEYIGSSHQSSSVKSQETYSKTIDSIVTNSNSSLGTQDESDPTPAEK